MAEHGTIIQIGDILVSEEVVTEFFCCDYEKCRGCCCVVGDGGAPLQESETEELEKLYPVYSPLIQRLQQLITHINSTTGTGRHCPDRSRRTSAATSP